MRSSGAGLEAIERLPDAGLLGTFGTTTAERLSLVRALARHPGPLARGRVLHMPVVLPCTVEAAHEVLVTQAKSFEKSPGLRVLLYPLAGQGLFTSEGSLWRSQRKLMAPIFQPAPLERYAETMRLVAERAADRLRDGERVDLLHETTRIAMSVVGKALFDAETFDEADELGAALSTGLAWVNRNLAAPGLVAHVLLLDALDAAAQRLPGRLAGLARRAHRATHEPFLVPGARDPALRGAVRVLDERIGAMIRERRARGLDRDDLLTRLLVARDEDAGGARMTDKQVRDEAVTLFVAGHETTATALAWSFYLLARNPDALARARAEADALGSGPLERWEPARFAYCARVFREAMRLYPPIMMFPRRTLEPVRVCGVALPARTLVFVSAHAVHYRADVYEDPERFDPDRWLPEREASRPRGAYLPFSAGPRFCIGAHFAMMEGPVVLATLLRRWRFEVDPARTIEEDDFATLRPRGGVPAVVRAR